MLCILKRLFFNIFVLSTYKSFEFQIYVNYMCIYYYIISILFYIYIYIHIWRILDTVRYLILTNILKNIILFIYI